jgi:hypothetical protein
MVACPPKSGAAALLLGREERLEHAIPDLGGNPRPGVGGRQLHVVSAFEVGVEADMAGVDG